MGSGVPPGPVRAPRAAASAVSRGTIAFAGTECSIAGAAILAGASRDMRRTKIVATIGPASREPGACSSAAGPGGRRRRPPQLLPRRRTTSTWRSSQPCARSPRRTGRAVAILQDLSGPKIRTGRLKAAAGRAREGERHRHHHRRDDRGHRRAHLHHLRPAAARRDARATASCSTTATSSCAWSRRRGDEVECEVVARRPAEAPTRA